MRILLVEDEAKVSTFVARGLTEERFAVDVARDGKSGLDLATTYHYDLVILDLMLPMLDGNQVLRSIRKDNVEVPVLILTARDAVADKVGNFEAGADDYLTKPVSLEELGLLVNRLLSRRHAEESLAYYRRREEQRSGLDRITGVSPRIVELKRQIAQVLSMEARQLSGPPPPVSACSEQKVSLLLLQRGGKQAYDATFQFKDGQLTEAWAHDIYVFTGKIEPK